MASKEIWLPLVDWSQWFARVTCNWSLTYTVQYSLSIGGDGKNLHTILDVGNAYRGPHTGCGWSCCRGVGNGPICCPKVEAFQNWGQQHQCQSLKRMRWFTADSCFQCKKVVLIATSVKAASNVWLVWCCHGGAFLERRNLFSSAYRFVGHLS